MNIYPCCFRGNLGYGCRIRGRRWMFVPEFGQPDHNVHRNLSIGDLRFSNPRAQTYERSLERPFAHAGIAGWLRGLPSGTRTRTAGGLLLTSA